MRQNKQLNKATRMAMAGYGFLIVPLIWIFVSPFFDDISFLNKLAGIAGLIGFTLLISAAIFSS